MGRTDRNRRLTQVLGGSWASSSQDYVRLANLLFEQSESCARSLDGNCSIFTLAGIPMLFAAIRALVIEGNSGMYGEGKDLDFFNTLVSSTNEISLIAKHYALPDSLNERLKLLYELRNEIVHPAHTPAGTKHGTPEYLVPLRQSGLLQSTHDENTDYTWIAQLQSHRLFGHTFGVIAESASIILKKHHASQVSRAAHLESYMQHKSIGP